MEQFFTKLKRGRVFLLSWISAILLVAMSFLVIYQVFTRYVLNSPSDFTEEIVPFSPPVDEMVQTRLYNRYP